MTAVIMQPAADRASRIYNATTTPTRPLTSPRATAVEMEPRLINES